MTEAVELCAPDPGWASAFVNEHAVIAPILGVNARLIEHIGSTAIPGLPAKPIIDIIVLVDDLDVAKLAIPALEATGYSFWADNPDRTRLFLVRGLPPAPRRTHHLHIHDDADEVQRHLMFRNHLRNHPDVQDAYHRLKAELAARYCNDREAYAMQKSGFIDELVRSLGGPARRH